MKVDGARNNIKYFTATYKDPLNPVKDANWITGKHTNLQEFANASVDGKANIMAKADIYTGVIPVKYSGDFGTPYINQVPFTTKSTIATSANTSFTIDTKLVWQPLSLFAKVVLEFRRVVGGVYQVYSSLIFEGPSMVRKINQDLLELLKADGYDNISEAIGANLR
jgi:hypothetical protein